MTKHKIRTHYRLLNLSTIAPPAFALAFVLLAALLCLLRLSFVCHSPVPLLLRLAADGGRSRFAALLVRERFSSVGVVGAFCFLGAGVVVVFPRLLPRSILARSFSILLDFDLFLDVDSLDFFLFFCIASAIF